jgi:teichuronic acid biosynthesis glycosyltransferase TuaG
MKNPRDMKFSVVIPCYKDSENVKRAVDCCFAQSLQPYEVIVIDDGSKEFTHSALTELQERYKNKNLVVVYLERNSGVSVARNRGIQLAKGDFICFLDSDDLWHPDKLRVLAAFLADKKGMPVVTHDYSYELKGFYSYTPDVTSLSYKEITFRQILFKNPVMTPSLVIPNGVNQIFNERMRYAEDHELLLRLAEIAPIYYINEKMVYISRPVGSQGGLSGNLWKMRKGELAMYCLLARRRPQYYVVLPFLISYSLLKHLRRMCTNAIR